MDNKKNEIKKMKVYLINKLVKLQREQSEVLEMLNREINKGELLTVKQVLNDFNISRSTFDRWRGKGLKVYQDMPKSAIRVKREDVLKFIK